MGKRLSKIYTRTGDDGTTGTGTGDRLSKNSQVFVAMGDIDELNSHLGMVMALLSQDMPVNTTQNSTSQNNTSQDDITHTLSVIAHLLFNLGGELAMPKFVGITKTHTQFLEHAIDTMNDTLPSLQDFILPKGTPLVCQIHIARSVARRAERSCVRLQEQTGQLSADSLTFINRLSDYLFVLARFVTPTDSVQETLWDKRILDNL